MKTIQHLLVCVGLAISGGLFAQSHGTVKYDIEMDSPNEQMRAQMTMMSGSSMTMYFDNENSRTEMNMGGLNTTSVIHNEKSDRVLTLTDIPMLGKKIAVFNEKDEESDPNVEIIHHKETKTILGYTCNKVTVIVEDEDNTEESTYYVAPAISYKGPKNKFARFDLEGFPLQMEVISEMQGQEMTMTMTATEFSKEKPDENLFSHEVPEGYTEMTVEEVMEMQKQMMGN